MKKIAKKIALLLVLVMLANSFSGCTIFYLTSVPKEEIDSSELGFCIGLDLLVYGVPLLLYGLAFLVAPRSNYASAETIRPVSEEVYNSLAEKIVSLPEEEVASFIRTVDSLPEAEKTSFIEKINSLSDAEFASLVSAFTSAPETEIVSSMHRINSLNEPQLSSFVNVLQHIEVGFSPDNRAYLGVHFRY
ncbi:MAG: hypothetical protein LBI28_11865 [Treponema sp.]|jgi:hypothetical protein|nr:hypothetical protein [Treponema sp.]